MKKTTQVACLLVTFGAAMISSSANAGVDNCKSYWPKVPYNCVMVKVRHLPPERADFSAFETGAVKASSDTASNRQLRYRSMPRDEARKLQAQFNKTEN